MIFTYLLKSKKDSSYYTGITDDLEDRLKRHNKGRIISTKKKIPWDLVYKKEMLALIKRQVGITYKNLADVPSDVLSAHHGWVKKYSEWKEIPEELIRKHSSADFHSLWLTWGFGLGKTETFVDLTLDMKKIFSEFEP